MFGSIVMHKATLRGATAVNNRKDICCHVFAFSVLLSGNWGFTSTRML